MRGFLRDEEGQALVEYVLMLLVAISLLGIMAKGFRSTVFKLWSKMSKEIAAPCAGCAPPGG